MPAISAGLLMYRTTPAGLQVLLGHPGGPLWRKKDDGAWTLPKGEVEAGESPLDAARREFQEETSLIPTDPLIALGSIRQKAGKIIHAWAFRGDCDPARLRSNLTHMQWPPRSGTWTTFPELDRFDFFNIPAAKQKANPAQGLLLDRLVAEVAAENLP